MHDPNFNGIELAWDRPRSDGNSVVFNRKPLDFVILLSEPGVPGEKGYFPKLLTYN